MSMPSIRPLRIKTKGETLPIKLFRWITSIREWELLENWHYVYQGHEYVIPKGFVFDGASIPRLLWVFLSPTGLLLIPGLIHDYGYRYQYLWEVDKDSPTGYKKSLEMRNHKEWDKLFHEVSKEVNEMAIISGLAYVALWVFGGFAWASNRRKSAEELYPWE